MTCRIFLLFFLVLGSFLHSCKKEDDLSPVITLNSPSGNQSFMILDEIRVIATIKDETTLKSVTISIVNDNGTPVCNDVTLKIEGEKTYSLDQGIEINNTQLKSGTYSVLVTASDGFNQTRKFQKVEISEIPLYRKAIYFSSYSGNSSIYKIDSLYQVTFNYSQNSNLRELSFNPSYQQLIMGFENSSVTARSVKTNSNVWSVENSNSFTQNDACVYNSIYYSALSNGFVHGYDYNGVNLYTFNCSEGYYPRYIKRFNNYFFCDQKEQSGQLKKLVLYHPETATGLKEINHNFEFCDVFQKEETVYLLFINENLTGKIREYDSEGNYLNTPYPYSLPEINSVCQINSNIYLMAAGGKLYKYDFNQTSSVEILSGYSFNKLVYDAVSNEVLASEGNKLHIFSYPDLAIKKTITHSQVIVDFEIAYNK